MKPIELGRMRVHKVHEMDSPTPLLMNLPGVTAEDIARMRRWYDAPGEIHPDPEQCLMTFGVHSWVIDIDDKRILVDACDGNHKNRSVEAVHQLNTDYLGNLARAGFQPEDIDMVMCTHLHFDHIGWNTRLENGQWVPTFRNARYVFGQRDYDYFKANPEGEAVHFEAFQDSILPVMEAGQGELVEADFCAHRAIGNGVWLEPAFGHSPGNVIVNAQADGAPAIFWGDVIHHPIQMIRFDLPFAFDADPVAASRVRQEVMARAADEQIMCFPAHFRGTSAGHVHRDGDLFRYQWVEE